MFNENIIITKYHYAGFIPAGTGGKIHKDRPWSGLALNISGIAMYRFDGKNDYIVHEGEIIYLPKNSNYKVIFLKPGDFYAINFDTDLEVTPYPEVISSKETNVIIDLFEQSVSYWLKDPKLYNFKLFSLLYSLIDILKNQKNINEKNSTIHPLIIKAVNYIDDNYTNPNLTILEITKTCDISDTYFRKLFYDFCKTTPVKYITQKRMELAKYLIQSNLYHLNDISFMCGYENFCVFSRCFKQYYKVSPSKFKV